MTNPRSARWWLVSAAVLLLTTGLSASPGEYIKKGCSNNDGKCPLVAVLVPVPVPEGGSAVGYLLGVGVTFLGALFVRSRLGKPRYS